MKSELQLLIAELEAEAELLQKELDQCLADDKNWKTRMLKRVKNWNGRLKL